MSDQKVSNEALRALIVSWTESAHPGIGPLLQELLDLRLAHTFFEASTAQERVIRMTRDLADLGAVLGAAQEFEPAANAMLIAGQLKDFCENQVEPEMAWPPKLDEKTGDIAWVR